MARFQARPELGLCATHVQNFWIPELTKEAERFRNHRISQPMPGCVTQALLSKRTLFDTVGLFNPTLGHGDSTEWFLCAAEHGTVKELLLDVLLYRHLHQANRSRLLASQSPEQFLGILKAVLDCRRSQRKEPTERETGKAHVR